MEQPTQTSSSPDSTAVSQLIKRHGIGLTGGIATGKSTVAAMLRQRGHLVFDADKLARQVVSPQSPGLALIVSSFGSTILAEDGSLNRAALRQIIFNDPLQKARLDAIMHPLIRAALGHELKAAGLLDRPQLFFYEAALLFETGTAQDFRAIWATHCSSEVQLARLMQRDGVTLEAARAALRSQAPAAEKARRADLAIDTSGTTSGVERQVDVALAGLVG